MKFNYKRLFFILVVFNITVLVFLGLKIVRADNSDLIPSFKSISSVDNFSLKPHIQNISKDKLIQNFPYKLYLDSANYDNVNYIKRDLAILDAVFPNDSLNNQGILSAALTDSLCGKIGKKYDNYSPDSIIYLMQWAEKFKNYAEYDSQRALLYSSIHDFWQKFIAISLEKYSNKSQNLKYDFKFKFLLAKCSENQFDPPIKVTQFEKVVSTILAGAWPHLLNASWNQSSMAQKTCIFFLFSFTIISYFVFIRHIYYLTLKKKKNGL